ncbi:hypothetical protein BKA62DRAFT_822734 [Auriculariales sp. MPI-PUGE-AT-0066]|nr:hypothetical protein BKA62DRAFT_822734 [Auriculariales sp. MPI-PUGE-AT-0066]
MSETFVGAPVHFRNPDDYDTPHDHGYVYPQAVSKYVHRVDLHFHPSFPLVSLKAEDIAEWLCLVSHASFIDVVGSPAVRPVPTMSFPGFTHLQSLSIRSLHQAIIFRILQNTVCLESANINCWDHADMNSEKVKSSARLSLPRLRILAISGYEGSGENVFVVVIRSSIRNLQSLSMDVKYPQVAVALDQPNHIEHLRLYCPFFQSTRQYNVLTEAVRIIRPCGRVRHLELEGYESVFVSMILSSISQPLQSLAITTGEPLEPGILTGSPCTRTLRVFAAPISWHPTLRGVYSHVGRRIRVVDRNYSLDPRDHSCCSHIAWFGSRFHRGTNEIWATGQRNPPTKDSGHTWCTSRLFSILWSCRTTDS